jgi:Zn-dependent protease with chaperone function
MTNSSSWRELYTAAMLELDRATLPGRIEGAQAAVLQALEELADNYTLEAGEEKQAMADALRNLRTLQRVEFRSSAPTASQGQPLAEG